MTFGNSVVMVGNEWSIDHKSPKSVGGRNTQTVHVQLAEGEDIDAHCERARLAGAEILQEAETQFYGDRAYRARDPEGHIWTFGVTEKRMTPQEWDKASGLTTKKRLPSGAMSWAVRYRFNGAPKKLTLGPHPAIGLKAARDLASRALVSGEILLLCLLGVLA